MENFKYAFLSGAFVTVLFAWKRNHVVYLMKNEFGWYVDTEEFRSIGEARAHWCYLIKHGLRPDYKRKIEKEIMSDKKSYLLNFLTERFDKIS